MFSHVFVSVSDFDRALRFYQPLMASLGLAQRFCEADKPWAGWHSAGGTRPLFVISRPFNGEAHHPGNGQTIAFLAESRAMVRAAHQVALAHGGRCDGPPGLRPQYHAHYYGAYMKDPDCNKLCVACHAPQARDGD
jgi:lactoylglutathione lyase